MFNCLNCFLALPFALSGIFESVFHLILKPFPSHGKAGIGNTSIFVILCDISCHKFVVLLHVMDPTIIDI